MKKILLILILLALPFVSSYTINTNETFTIDLNEILNISLTESNDTSITVNVMHPFCNTTQDCPYCNTSLNCEECVCPSHNQSDLDLITSLNSQITNLNLQLAIAQNNISFYKEQISNLTSEIAKKENFINNILTNFTHECPAFPPIPSCPACPVCTIPSLPSCPSYNLTCPESQIIMPNPNEEQKPSKLPWILSGVLFVMLVITFINLAKKNKEPGEEVSEEFAEEFKG